MPRRLQAPMIEWPTLAMLVLCYGLFAVATVWLPAFSVPLAIGVTSIAIALHSSLSHEMLHGHPFKHQWLNDLLVCPALGLFVPYLRFKDTHLAHHKDADLTDPYDDPESNYLDPAIWAALAPWRRRLLRFNNTMLGRLTIGPLIGQLCFMRRDWGAIGKGDRRVTMGWLWHIPAVAVVLVWCVSVASLPFWAYLLSAYLALSILKIRTFLEHQSHELTRGRSVIIEDNGLFGWIFLFNSLHVVHHMHPRVPWYGLKPLFRSNRGRYLRFNEGYYYPSYWPVLKRFFLQAKDPVPHPLWPKD